MILSAKQKVYVLKKKMEKNKQQKERIINSKNLSVKKTLNKYKAK